MLIEKLKRSKIQFPILKKRTKVCKLCFKEINENSLKSIANPGFSLCSDCYEKLKPCFKTFEVMGVKCLSIYNYDDNLKTLIYQFKGCFDYELKDIFLERYILELRLFYSSYNVIPIPSYLEDDKTRGFNHVYEIFSSLKLNMIQCIKKTAHVKQSDRNAEERSNIIDFLEIENGQDITEKRILLVDDIFTTGSTIKACIELIKKYNPKEIKVLVLCKTLDLEKK